MPAGGDGRSQQRRPARSRRRRGGASSSAAAAAAAAVLCVLLALLTGAAAIGNGLDLKLRLGVPYAFNPSIVALPGGGYMAGARTAYMKGVAGRWWWINAAYICKDSDINFPSPVCTRFDPFNGDFRECMWRGLVDTRGIEDPKLFVWPGRGLFAVFNRKPRAPAPAVAPFGGAAAAAAAAAGGSNGGGDGAAAADDTCPTNAPLLTQWLVALQPAAGAKEWALRAPVPLKVSVPGFYDAAFAKGKMLKEKNWMPLVHSDTLYMVHSIFPQHRVFQIAPDGATTLQLLSQWPRAVSAPLEGHDIHGGPPVVHVPGDLLAAAGLGRALRGRGGGHSGVISSSGGGGGGGFGGFGGGSSSGGGGAGGGGFGLGGGGGGLSLGGEGYHLGVLHYFTVNRTVHAKGRSRDTKYYTHYLYKMRARPPFEPCALSRELPLRFRAKKGNGTNFQQQRIWKDTSHTAFVSGLYLERSAPGAGHRLVVSSFSGGGGFAGAPGEPRLLISYGSSDIDSRLLVLSLRQLEAMFAGLPSTC